MSVISLLIIEPSQLPTLDAVRAGAEQSGEGIDLFDPADLTSHTGFLPVRVAGRDTGFEYYYDAIPAGALPADAMTFGSHHIITRTGSDFEEGRAALMFLKVVSRLSGGAYVYPDDGIIVPPDKVQAYLAEQISEFGKHIKPN